MLICRASRVDVKKLEKQEAKLKVCKVEFLCEIEQTYNLLLSG